MANNSKDVSINIAVKTDGSESVRKFAEELDKLGKEAGAAAPEFERLSAEVNKIAQQTGAVETFAAIDAQVTKTAESFKQAQTRIEALGTTLAEQKAVTEGFAATQQTIKQSVDATATQLREYTAQLRTLRANSNEATRGTDEYKASVQALRQQIAPLQNLLAEQKAAYKAASEQTSIANSALKDSQKAYDQAAKGVERLSTALSSQNAALNGARTAVVETGVSATSLADATKEVADSFTKVRGETETAIASFEKMRALQDAIATSNERAAKQARDAASARANASKQAAAADAETAREAEAAALKQRLVQDSILANIKAIKAQAASAQQALDDAFAKTGVRSAEAIQAEIAQINNALLRLQTNADVSGQEFDRAFASAQQRIAALQAELTGVPEKVSLASRAAGVLKNQFVQLAGAYGVLELGKKFIDANVQIETLRRSLTLITGSSEAAASQIAFLKATADSAGIAFGDITKEFVNFSAATKTSNIPLETTNALFKTLVNSAGQLGLSSEQVGLTLNALAQIASKGKVQLEELQGQLGDSLPGALSIAAKGLGITELQLRKLAETGQLLAEDFFPAFNRGLQSTFGAGTAQVEGLGASISRLKNQFTDLAQAFGDGGLSTVLIGTFKALGIAIGATGVVLNGFFEAVFTGARQVGVVVAAIVNRDFANLSSELSRLTEEAGARLAKQEAALARIAGVSDTASTSTDALATATTQAGAAASAAAAGVQANAAAQQATATAATQAANAQAAAATNTAQAGSAASEASGSWVKLTAAYLDNKVEIERLVDEKKKLYEATKLQGEVSVQIATIGGNEVAALNASAAAANNTASAAEALTRAKTTELQALINLRDGYLAEIRDSGVYSAAKAKEIETTQQKINVAQAELQVTQQQSEAAKFEAAQREIVSATYADNATRIDEYKKAVLEAAAANDVARVQLATGVITEKEAAEAAIRLAKANALLKDAYNDAAAAADRKVSAIQRDLNITQASLNVELQRAKTAQIVAEAQGNERLATEAKIRQKEIEVKITQANNDAKQLEAKAIIAAAEAERTALETSGQLTEAKKAEIEARIASARAKTLEAEAGKEVVRQLEAEIEAIRNRNEVSAVSASGGGSGGGGIGGVATPNGNSIPISQARGLSFSNDNALFTLKQKQAAGTLTADDLKLAEAAFMAADANRQTYQANLSAYSFNGATGILTDYNVARGIYEKVRNQAAAAAQGQRSPASTPDSGGGGGSTYTVNVNLGGRTSQVNTASQGDQQALVALLQQLENASGRAGV